MQTEKNTLSDQMMIWRPCILLILGILKKMRKALMQANGSAVQTHRVPLRLLLCDVLLP